MHVAVPSFGSFSALYETDPLFGPILSDVHAGLCDGFTLTDGFLFHSLQLCVPDCSLRVKMIEELHKEGHVPCGP